MLTKKAYARFEYGAILNGSQTYSWTDGEGYVFEYGAILNGSQTIGRERVSYTLFEYGAILNGSQTAKP